jgi:hypothetical protein
MSLRIAIAGLGVELRGPALILEALRGKLGAFQTERVAEDDVCIEIGSLHDEFEPDLRLDRDLRVDATIGDRGVMLRGAAKGGYDPKARRGWLDAPRNLGEIDGIVRLALALELPRRGALLLHAAAVVPARRQQAIVLAGASGAGKSTSARAFGRPLADELSVVALAPAGLEVFGTPYWNGCSERVPLDRIVLLDRGGASAPEPLSGGRAVALLASHMIRYVADETLDRRVFELTAEVCERTRPIHLCCPEGDAFLPHLAGALGLSAGPLTAGQSR